MALSLTGLLLGSSADAFIQIKFKVGVKFLAERHYHRKKTEEVKQTQLLQCFIMPSGSSKGKSQVI